jgi:hypothetical protein
MPARKNSRHSRSKRVSKAEPAKHSNKTPDYPPEYPAHLNVLM